MVTLKRSFLDGGGDMGALMRDHPWHDSCLGAPAGWPQPLRTVVRAMLNTNHPVFIFWGSDALCFYNDAYARTLGPEKHPSILGRPGRTAWAEIWHAIGPQIVQVMEGGNATWHENQRLSIWRNGQLADLYWTYSYSPIDDDEAANGIGGVLVLCNETTDHILRMQKANEERQRFAELFEQAPGFMTMLNGPQHIFEFANPGYMTLVDGRDILGQPLATALPEAAQQGYLAMLDRVYASGQAHAGTNARFDTRAAPDAPVVTRYLDFVFQPIKNESGAVRGIFVQGNDVTERKLAANRRDALVRLSDDIGHMQSPAGITLAAARILVDTLGVSRAGYATFDADGAAVTVESEWRGAGGTDSAALPARFDLHAFGSHIDERDPGAIVVVDDAGADPRTAGAAHRLPAHGAAAFVNVPVMDRGRMLAVLFVHHGTARHWTDDDLALLREIGARIGTATERLRADMALREMNETLEAKVQARSRELMLAEEALRHSQKMEAVGQLTGGLAHDFNNLLAGIMGSLDMLRIRLGQGRLTELDRYVDMAQRSSRRAAALTHRLLAFSRRQTLAPKSTDVNQLISGMEELIRRTVGPEITLQVVGADGLWPALIDPSQLENALLNLCINARDAMPEGGRLTIETANRWLDEPWAAERELVPGRYISLSITDTGTGMPPEVAARAFDPFFTTKPLGEGTGLGLSMVYGFARQSGGQIRIYSEPGLGTSMTIYLPRHGEAPLAAADETTAQIALDPRQSVVLVVDDEETVRALVVDVLAECGYVALEAADGPSALRILETGGRIDLLVTDVGLPGGMNGRQVADAARVRRPGLKILFITGYAENAVMGSGNFEPGMQVITKPFVLGTFAARVREMIEMP